MIRLYFDSDVINSIHAGRMPELAEFIKNNRHRLLIAFSQAHVNDKLPSKQITEDKFWDDIDFITELTDKKLLYFDDKKGYTTPCIADARQMVDEVEDNKELLEEFSDIDNIIKFMKESSEELGVPSLGSLFESLFDGPAFNAISPEWAQAETYKEQLQKVADHMSELRNNPDTYKANQDLVRTQYSLPTHAGQWTDKVVDKINIHLKSKEENKDFFELVDGAFQDKSKITTYSYYTTAYQVLNMIGYKSDEISAKKGKGMMNHLQDAMHSFYGAHCDYFVVIDKKLRAKSSALYEKFGVTTKLIHPNDLMTGLSEVWGHERLAELISRVLSQDPVDKLIEEGVHKWLYRINGHWLDYFTHIQVEIDPENGVSTYLFAKMGATYSNFMFYDEHDRVIESVLNILGVCIQRDEVIEKFKSPEPDDRFVEYLVENTYIRLFMDGSKFYLRVSIVEINKPDNQ